MHLREGLREKRWCISERGRKGGVSQGGTEGEKVVYLREGVRKGGVSQGGTEGEKVVYLREELREKRWCISGRD